MATKKTADTKKKTTTKKEQKKNKLRKIGALWLRSAKNTGTKYMSGVVDIDDDGNSLRLVVFKNGYKEENKHPDYIIYIQEDDNLDREATADKYDDDIPF